MAALPLTSGAEPAPAAPAAVSAPPGVVIDARTERVLLDACAFLRSAERFAVDVSVSYDDVLKSGKKVQYHRENSIVLERPNRLRVDGESDKGVRSVFYDGKTLTVFRPDRAVFATFDAPATIDATLDAIEQRGVVMPLDDLLRAHPCAGLAEHLKTASHAGRHYLDGGWYHHLLLETDAVDVQLWVAEGDEPVIRQVVITYRDAPGAPQFSAALTGWDLGPVIEPGTFAFTPPAGAKQVEFRGADDARGGGK
jgi:hypothetical protein